MSRSWKGHGGVREWGDGDAELPPSHGSGGSRAAASPVGLQSGGCGSAGDHASFAEPGRGSLLS